MELNRGCEVKRKTLNLVVSPVMFKIRVGRSFGGRRRQQRQLRKRQVAAYHSGV